ncbi:unnamed protein product [Linum trigynum]|uniref:Gnk2-homologous domain-containing protein n=1 Tax=Linum trigynum TaxID=586398 RepID=A0AAV2DSY5_9ROSI
MTSSLAIALYFLLGCNIVHFTEGTATCSGGKLKSGDPLAAARNKLFGYLIAKTFDAPYKQYCTWYPATTKTGGTKYVYGLANCASASKSCGGNYCSTTAAQCSACLTTARKRLVKECGKRVAGYAVVLDSGKQMLCSMQFTDAHLCS